MTDHTRRWSVLPRTARSTFAGKQRAGGGAGASACEPQADAFPLGPKCATALNYTRSQGDLVRFDPATSHKRSTNLEYFNVSCLMRF